MAKQSSRMYGIKVKEHANYYEYGSESDGGFITLYYNSGVWTVKAGKHNQHSASNIKWYRNVSGIGVEYDAGDTIVEFNDGDKVEFMVMEQHTDTTPYVNYMYDIYGNATEKIVNGTKDIFYRITPKPNSQYACKVYQYEDGMIKAEKEVTPEAIRYYKSAYSWLSDNPLLPVFNMLFDWHGTDPESGHLQMSFEAISNSNYIKYNGNFIQKGQTIREWQSVGFSEFKVEDETNKRSSSSLGTDVIPGVSLTKRIGGSKICDTVTKNKQTIFSDIYHDHKEAYYNSHYHKAMYLVYDNPGIDGCWPKKINNDIAITWADPFWFLVTNRAGIEYNGYTYEKHKLIKSWKGTDSVNLVLKKTTSRSVVSSNDSNYVKVVYDILALPDSEYVTVTKQSYFNGDYTDDDSAVIYQSDTPVDFYNIKFTYKASTNKWTIYSKCGYIKYGGRTYPKGRSILSFGTDEYDPEDPHPEIHLEITDETGKYIVEEVKTYYVKTPLSDQTLNYEVHTSSISKTVKVIKSKSGIEEPWITVNFYDAMYSPYEVDDIAFKYYNSSQSWALYSNNNNLYYNGSNKKKGELLREWAYNEIVTISNISITHDDLDSVEVKVLTKTNGVNYTNKDLDVTIDWFDESDPDFHLAYSYSKNLWVLTAITACYCGGILFTKGQVIKQFQSKVNVDRFMMMFPHTVEGQTEYAEYYVDVIVDNVGGGMTTVNVELPRHHSESFTDKDISRGDDNTVTFTKQDAASLYGYIWQKEEGPIPPPTPSDHYMYYLIPINVSDGVYGNGNRYIAAIRVEFGHRFIQRLAYNGNYNEINVIDGWIKPEYGDISDDFDGLFLEHFTGDSIKYRYFKSWYNGALNTNNWTYLSSFPPYPYSLNSSPFHSGVCIFAKKNGNYIRINFKTSPPYPEDDIPASIFVGKLTFRDSRLSIVDSESSHNNVYTTDYGSYPYITNPGTAYYNGKRYYYTNSNSDTAGRAMYIDKGTYLLIFSKSCMGYEQQVIPYCTARLNLDTLELIPLYKQKTINLIYYRQKAINDYGLIDDSYTTVGITNSQCTVGKYQLYLVEVMQTFMQSRWVRYAFKYDIEENSYEYLGEYYGESDAITGYQTESLTWRIPNCISDGKGYSYNIMNNILRVYELEDPLDFDCIFDGAVLVNTINLESNPTIQLFNVITRQYETFNLIDFFTNNGGYYPTSSGMYYPEIYYAETEKIINNGHHGMFKFMYTTTTDKVIAYFEDPTFKNLSASFCFYASVFRYRSYFDEDRL